MAPCRSLALAGDDALTAPVCLRCGLGDISRINSNVPRAARPGYGASFRKSVVSAWLRSRSHVRDPDAPLDAKADGPIAQQCEVPRSRPSEVTSSKGGIVALHAEAAPQPFASCCPTSIVGAQPDGMRPLCVCRRPDLGSCLPIHSLGPELFRPE